MRVCACVFVCAFTDVLAGVCVCMREEQENVRVLECVFAESVRKRDKRERTALAELVGLSPSLVFCRTVLASNALTPLPPTSGAMVSSFNIPPPPL